MEQQLGPKDFRQIQEQISQMIDTIQQALDYPPNQSPVSYLQHYNTLLAKTRSLISAIDGGGMNGGIGTAVNQSSSGGPQVLGKWKGLVVSPLVLHKADPEFYPRVLLRSKLIPEIESEQEEKKRMAAEAFQEGAAAVKETTSSVEVGLSFIFFLDPCLLLPL